MLDSNLTQTNALDYSIHIIFKLFPEADISPERAEIIKTIKSFGVEEDRYEELLSSNTIFFGNWVWN
jgi:hypothetical protein